MKLNKKTLDLIHAEKLNDLQMKQVTGGQLGCYVEGEWVGNCNGTAEACSDYIREIYGSGDCR